MSTEEKIIEIIRKCCALAEENITPDTQIKDISLDSLSFIQMIVTLETEFGIEFEDEDLNIAAYISVKDIISKAEELIYA